MKMDYQKTGKRLNKYLSDSGFCSRREADRLIQQGKVLLDGRPGALGDRVQPGMQVEVAGRQLSGQSRKVYLALHKPVGIVCTADSREPLNVVDYIGYPQRVYPVGRLDKDSSGLLLLTSDGEIVNRILRAAGGHEKEYVVAVDKAITPDFLRDMAQGVEILGRKTLPCRIHQLTVNSFSLVLVQGLNRQIRRMCEALGCRVRELRRVRVMNIRLGDLPVGSWRELTEEELYELNRLTGRNSRAHAEEAGRSKSEPASTDRTGRRRTARHKAAEGRTSWKSSRGSKNL